MIGRTAALLLAIVAVGSTPVAAQHDVWRGVVTDTAARPVVGAEVRTIPGGALAITDHRGRFSVVDSLHPVDSLAVVRIGYLPSRIAAPRPGTGAQIVLRPSPVVLASIVSVATRRDQAAADIATPILVVSRDVIEASGALSLDRLLEEVPGIQQLPEPPARSTLMIRGIGGSRVLVLIDGEPAPGALLEDRDLSRISLATAERVEIVRGPLAAIYGSEAIGGVINVVTRGPSGSFNLGGTVGIGSQGRRTATIQAGADGDVAWQASVGHRSLDAISTQTTRQMSLQRVWDGRVSFRAPLSDQLRLRVDGSGSRERQRWPIDGTMNAFNDNHAISGWAELQLDQGGTAYRARFSAQQFGHRYREADRPLPYEDTGAPLQRERAGRLLLTAARTLGGGHTLDIGSEIGLRWIESPDRLTGGSQQETGVDLWVNDAWQRGEWLITAAARQAWSSRWGTTFTPSLTAAWQPDAEVRLRAAIARGFRAPSFKETHWHFSNPTAGYEILGNLDLEPERSWQLSAGLTWQPVSGTVVDAEVYRNSLRNLIDFRFAGHTAAGLQIQQTTNISRALTRGLDVTVQQRLGGLALIGSWSWLHTRDLVSEESLPQRIPHSLRLSATQEIGAGSVTLAGRWLAGTPATTSGLAEREALLAFDLAVRWRLLRQFELLGGIDNLLDENPAGWNAPLERTVRLELQISP